MNVILILYSHFQFADGTDDSIKCDVIVKEEQEEEEKEGDVEGTTPSVTSQGTLDLVDDEEDENEGSESYSVFEHLYEG